MKPSMFLFIFILLSITFVSSMSINIPPSTTGNTTGTLNNSIYWDGHAYVLGSISAIESDPNYFSNPSGFVNGSYYLNSNPSGFVNGSYTNTSSFNSTQMDYSGGYINILESWVRSLFYTKSELYNLFVPYLGANKSIYLNNQTLEIMNTKGANVTLNNFVEHTQELMTDTLLDKSRSTLSCSGGVLNYTLIAVNGCGQFNYNGTLYPTSGSPCVQNATISLTCGTDITPIANYIYWELVGGVSTMKTASTYPSSNHIDVATFIVGACSGSSYTIYSYSRNRYEVDTFIKRVIERFEESGALYVDGFVPGVNTTTINITSGGSFFNGIFEMTSTNFLPGNNFYYINSTGNFVQANSLATFTQYADGSAMTGANLRVNIVWGVVPINTTGGVGPTQMRLVAVLPNAPTAAYNDVNSAIADIYDTTNYYPPNSDVKQVFVPIARTIVRPNTDLFEPFSTGKYFKDIRGQVTGGGSAPQTSVIGLTESYSMLNSSSNQCWVNYTLGVMTWSNCK